MTALQPTYADFLDSKAQVAVEAGLPTINPSDVNPILKPHQRDAVTWAVRGGRRAIFASFGLGKTMMQLEAVRLTRILENPPPCMEQSMAGSRMLDPDVIAEAMGVPAAFRVVEPIPDLRTPVTCAEWARIARGLRDAGEIR